MTLVGPFQLRILIYDSKHNCYMLCLLVWVGLEEPQMFWKWNSFSELNSFSSFSVVLERKFLTYQNSAFQAGPTRGFLKLPFFFVQTKGRQPILSSSNYFFPSEALILQKNLPAACKSTYTKISILHWGKKKRGIFVRIISQWFL